MKDFYSYTVRKKSALKPDESEKQITGYTFTIYGNLIWKSIYLNKKVEGRMHFNTAFIQEVTAAVWFSVWGGSEPMPDAPDVLSGLLAGDVLSSFITRPQWAVKPWPQRQGQYRNLILKHKNTTKGTKPWRLKWIWVLVQNRLSGC